MTGGNHPLALVTGASAGIGMAFAEHLAGDGYDLLVIGRRADRLEELATRLGSEHSVTVEPVPVDLSTAAGLERVAALCSDRPLELLVNNAGLANYGPFESLSRTDAEEVLSVNVDAVVRLTHAALARMLERGRGSIINLASLLAFSDGAEGPNLPKRAVYAATKSFVVTFSRRLAAEVGDRGVRVQVLLPGIVRTEFHTRQGIDLSHVPRMEPDDIVRGSLAALASGEVVCIPALPDPALLAARDLAQEDLLSNNTRTELAERYR